MNSAIDAAQAPEEYMGCEPVNYPSSVGRVMQIEYAEWDRLSKLYAAVGKFLSSTGSCHDRFELKVAFRKVDKFYDVKGEK